MEQMVLPNDWSAKTSQREGTDKSSAKQQDLRVSLVGLLRERSYQSGVFNEKRSQCCRSEDLRFSGSALIFEPPVKPDHHLGRTGRINFPLSCDEAWDSRDKVHPRGWLRGAWLIYPVVVCMFILLALEIDVAKCREVLQTFEPAATPERRRRIFTIGCMPSLRMNCSLSSKRSVLRTAVQRVSVGSKCHSLTSRQSYVL